MYGYIYLTTNTVNDKKYIGQHRSSTFDKNYLGSGVLLLKAIKRYGRENFTTVLLEECLSDEELNQKEVYYISKYDAVNSEDFYNIARGGEGHTCTPWNANTHGLQKVTEKQLQALAYGWSLPASERQKQLARERQLGKVFSPATRKKISDSLKSIENATKGRVWIYCSLSDSYKRVKPEELNKYLNTGWVCQGPKQHRTEIQKSRYRKISEGRRHIHKGTQNKNVKPDEYASYIADGWEDGYYYKN